jgi:hypothetical protein
LADRPAADPVHRFIDPGLRRHGPLSRLEQTRDWSEIVVTPAIHADFVMTFHAVVRAQQRGLKRLAVELALALHDRVVAVGNGRQAWSVGRRRCAALREAGLPVSVVERLNRTILIVEPSTGRVITVVNGHADAARRYRRGEQGRKKWAWRDADKSSHCPTTPMLPIARAHDQGSAADPK